MKKILSVIITLLLFSCSMPRDMEHSSKAAETGPDLEIRKTVTGLPGEYVTVDGDFIIVNKKSKQVLDVSLPSLENGCNVQQWRNTGEAHQQWKISHIGDGLHTIFSLYSGKALDVENGSLQNGANIQQWDYFGSANQQWLIKSNNDGSFHILSARSQLALDIEGGSTSYGANLQQWAYCGTENQKWLLLEADTSVSRWFNRDTNGDGFLNYSATENSGTSYIEGCNEWGDIPVSENGLELRFNHTGDGSAYAHITSGTKNDGNEANSFEEKDTGKPISYSSTLQWESNREIIAGENPAYIKIMDKWGNSSQAVNIHDHAEVITLGHGHGGVGPRHYRGKIPCGLFYTEELDITNIVSVTIFVDPTINKSSYLPISYIQFNKDIFISPIRVDWLNSYSDENNDGFLNYSFAESINGSYAADLNEWNNLPVENGKVKLKLVHNGTGSVYVDLPTGLTKLEDSYGMEPGSLEEKEEGKTIYYYYMLQFEHSSLADDEWFNTSEERFPLYITLIDKWGQAGKALQISGYYKYPDSTYPVKAVQIPCQDFFTPELDISNIVSVTFFVDNSIDAGTYRHTIERISFRYE